MARSREPGKNGIWVLPDGRAVFYPPFHDKYGYLVETPQQESGIRWVGRALYFAAYLVAPIAAATASWVATAFLIVPGLALEFGLMRLLTARMRRIDEPMPLLRRLRLRAAGVPAGVSVAIAFACGILAVASISIGVGKGDPLAGLAMGAYLAFGGFAASYIWHTRRSTHL